MAMDVSKLDDVAEDDMRPVQRIEQNAPVNVAPTQTEVSFDLSFWKVNLRGFFKRVTGKAS
ncbi:hypothetical protein [Rhizobium sp. NRK18]|uniref:hypothetical protein n=1 Tax=Rhizobium sp. NRK18 TaxID=2964667 RepID=UPI0021C42BF2|nr:hypothetical protein [Rhizobium sp. NRK18]MCQ2002867.1 hypothetical protein [Rhizobium sp. NRK18]